MKALDWSYDFHQHDWDHGGSTNPECVKDSVKQLKILEKALKKKQKYEATTDGGAPRVGWGEVVEVGMGNPPYYRDTPPIPTVIIERESPMTGQLMREEFSFLMLRDIREKQDEQ